MTRRAHSPLDIIGACLWLDLEAHKKLVLLSLCENSDPYGICYPGREYIAKRASLSERNVSDHLKALEAEGWVKTVRKARGPGSTAIRRVNLDRIVRAGELRKKEFSEERRHSKSPLETLLDLDDFGDDDVIGAESAPITDPDSGGIGAESAPEQVPNLHPNRGSSFPLKGDLYDTQKGDPSRLRNQPVEPASETGSAEPPDMDAPSLHLPSNVSASSSQPSEKISLVTDFDLPAFGEDDDQDSAHLRLLKSKICDACGDAFLADGAETICGDCMNAYRDVARAKKGSA